MQSEDYIESVGRTFDSFAQQCTVRLDLAGSELKFPKPTGTAVLVSVLNQKYLISAAHVFDESYRKIIAIRETAGTYLTLGGEMVITRNSESNLNEKIDLAIIKLDNLTTDSLLEGGYNFYSMDGIDPDKEYSGEEFLHIYGYPFTRTKVNTQKKIIEYMPFNYITEAKNVRVGGYDNRLHLFPSYQRKKMTRKGIKGNFKGPSPQGMSGSGIWYCTNLFEGPDKLNFILAGIITEYIRERSLFVGVRINAITEIMRTRFSEKLPASKLMVF